MIKKNQKRNLKDKLQNRQAETPTLSLLSAFVFIFMVKWRQQTFAPFFPLLYFAIRHFKHAYPECTGEETRLTLSRWSAVQLYLLRESLSGSFVINRCCKAENNHYQNLTIYQRFIPTFGKKL